MKPVFSQSILNQLSKALSYEESRQCLIEHGYSYRDAIDLLDNSFKLAQINCSHNTDSYV